MIISRMTMHNFGVYAGTNTFQFSNKKPVILIGGMNGRGKTTFLEAVLISLYGSNSFAYKESPFTSYGQYLRSYINQNDGSMKAYIEMEFVLSEVKERYLIRREWSAISKRTTENLYVEKDGEPNEFLSKNWAMFIETILPAALSNFFFFDGEKIADMAMDNTDSQMKASIRSMLGITVLDTLANDLHRLMGKLSKGRGQAVDSDNLASLQKERDEAEAALIRIDKEIEVKMQELQDIQERTEELREQYLARGGDVIESRNSMIDRRQVLLAQRENATSLLYDFAAGELPLRLVSDLLKDIKLQAEDEHNDAIMRTVVDTVNALFEEFRKLNTSSKKQRLDREFINFVNNKINQEAGAEIYMLSDQGLVQVTTLLETKLLDTKTRASEVMESKEAIQKKLDQIDSYLSIDVNENEAKKIYREIKVNEEHAIDTEMEIRRLQERRANLNGNFIRIVSEHNKSVEKFIHEAEANDDANRIVKYSRLAEKILREYSIKLQANKTDNLSKTITTCYKKLESKKNLIDMICMDPETLDLKYYDASGNEVPKAILSAGEKQLMVTSILWALAVCSRKKLPVIIDTPLSRLDSIHRKSLIQVYFPNASEQTIILSTDSEIGTDYYEMMKENVGDEFTLVYSDDTKSTSIQEGYFSGRNK